MCALGKSSFAKGLIGSIGMAERIRHLGSLLAAGTDHVNQPFGQAGLALSTVNNLFLVALKKTWNSVI